MSERVLPERPNVGQLRRLAKELRVAARAGDPGAVERVRKHVDDDPATMSLSAAQLVVAREHGFASWPRLTEELEARRVGLAGLSGLAFARAVAAGMLEAEQTVVLAGRVVSVAADARDAERLRLALVPAIGAAPGGAPDEREIVISCRRDARMRTARGLSAGERLDGPGLTSGEDQFRVEGEIGAERVKPGHIVLIAGVVAASAAVGHAERVELVLRDADWGEFVVVCPAVEFAVCMRSHGVPNFPDPNNQGGFSTKLRASAPQVQAANKACQTTVPTGDDPLSGGPVPAP